MAFATTAGHEMLRAEGIDLSVEFLYWAAKLLDGRPMEDGTTLGAAAAALANAGQPPEVLWPYDADRDHRLPGYEPSSEAREAGLKRRFKGASSVDPGVEAIKSALDDGTAVVLGLLLHAEWFAPMPNGRIEMPPRGADPIGTHAVLVAGYADGEGEGGGRLLLRNSWGADWGDQGYGLIAYAYVEQHALGALSLSRQS